ncbi:MAG: DNA repair protein RadA, partial [Cyclobacteriaceae bacterium]|nr:DNA repair protein RadA [Cyclobacteriaceae bacterium]
LGFKEIKSLYVSGEESTSQIKMRATRMGLNSANCFFYTETSLTKIFKAVKSIQPNLLIIDSIQTMQSAMVDAPQGSIPQVRQSAAEIIRYAKETATPVFLVGHITKDGAIAGPKVLEHMVDTVLQFEGDRNFNYRILRTIKNRFGSTAELGIYDMQGNGLREVSNPSEVLVSQKEGDLSGSAISAMVEGNRPLLIETQSLVSPATYGTPQRTTTGFDGRRLNMLLAVLERRCGFRLGQHDVFLNMAGGIRVSDPAVDLAIAVSVISSLEEIPLSGKMCFAAEIGLGGELRAVNRIENRIMEAEKLGYEVIYLSKYNKLDGANKKKITVKALPRLTDVFMDLFG